MARLRSVLSSCGRSIGGIGVHSFSELTYNVKGQYSKFVAYVGIDDSVKPNGNVSVEILGDGKVLKKIDSVTGKDKMKQISVNIAGIKKLTLRVNFGSDKLGIGDHLDFAGAKLIK